MNEDLLTRIQRETHERLRELRDAVDEHDRLAGRAQRLDCRAGRPSRQRRWSRLRLWRSVPEPPRDPEPPTNVVRLPARPRVPRTRMVSPKVARLMRAPRRPALERAGVVRVGVGRFGALAADDLWPQETGGERGGG